MNQAMSTLEVHVFGGASKGECIVIKLPNGEYGVVDSCLGDSNADFIPPVQFLKERKVEELSFLCLTHPHDDHFSGMLEFLNEFRVTEFWHSGALSQQHLRWIITQEIVDSRMVGDRDRESRLNELMKIYKKVAALRKRPPQRRRKRKKKKVKVDRQHLVLRPAVLGTSLFPFPQPRAGTTITAIAPSGEEKDAYERSLGKCFVNGELVESSSRDHNQISLGLIVKCGTTVVVLGGDVEKKNWEAAIRDYAQQLEANLVKVSHHGSKNSYCEGLWEAHGAGDSTTHAVCTGYRSSGLPRTETLDEIRKQEIPIYLTHKNHVPREKMSADEQKQSRSALGTVFKNLVKKSPSIAADFELTKQSSSWGRCSFTFDVNGTLVSEEFTESAITL